LSKPAAQAEELPALYTTLRRALFVSRRLGVTGILGQSELALYSVLFETQDETSLDAFLETTIGTLLAHDRKKSSELASTLLCYFDANRNARLVAKRMTIHVNTVRQRLTTIEEMLGHLGNPTRALEIHMALRLWALSKRSDLLPKYPREEQVAPYTELNQFEA
jgi:DNA-binding PucR family transcriptional regulator